MENVTGRVQFKIGQHENYERIVRVLTEEFNASVMTTPLENDMIITGLFGAYPKNTVDNISELLIGQYITLERMV